MMTVITQPTRNMANYIEDAAFSLYESKESSHVPYDTRDDIAILTLPHTSKSVQAFRSYGGIKKRKTYIDEP